MKISNTLALLFVVGVTSINAYEHGGRTLAETVAPVSGKKSYAPVAGDNSAPVAAEGGKKTKEPTAGKKMEGKKTKEPTAGKKMEGKKTREPTVGKKKMSSTEGDESSAPAGKKL